MTRDEIFERVRELLTKTFGLPAEKVTPTALLQKDLDRSEEAPQPKGWRRQALADLLDPVTPAA